MTKRTFTDTALAIATVALLVAYVVTLFWVGGGGPWLRATHFLVFLLATYGVSVAMHIRADRRLDEVELAAARFGARWGLVSGIAFMTVLAVLPPIHSLLARIAGVFGRLEDDSMTVESRLFLLGVVATFVAQEIFRSVFAAAWRWSKR